MTTTLFSTFPDDARLWVYAADRALTPDDQAALHRSLRPFLDGWTSHARPVRGEAVLLHDRFLLVAATLAEGALSGCGIDASVHAIEAAGRAADVHWLSPLLVLYRDADGSIQHLPRAAFRKRVRSGHVTAGTPVFDLSLTTVGALREAGLERPAGAAWHATVFRIPQAV